MEGRRLMEVEMFGKRSDGGKEARMEVCAEEQTQAEYDRGNGGDR